MTYIIGCLMASLSFLLNKLLLRYVGNQVVITYSPIIEEVAKTLCSYYLGGDIWLTHVIFGILEAIYDWFSSDTNSKGVLAAVLSIAGHSLFGAVTLSIFDISGSIFGGIFIAICVHVAWNVTFIRLYG